MISLIEKYSAVGRLVLVADGRRQEPGGFTFLKIESTGDLTAVSKVNSDI